MLFCILFNSQHVINGKHIHKKPPQKSFDHKNFNNQHALHHQ